MNVWQTNGHHIAYRASPPDYKYTAASHGGAQIEAACSLGKACTSSHTACRSACPTSCMLHFVLIKLLFPSHHLLNKMTPSINCQAPFLHAAARWPIEAATMSDLGDYHYGTEGVCICVCVRECWEITFSVSAVRAFFLSRQIALLREQLLGWQSHLSLSCFILPSVSLYQPTCLFSVILAPNISWMMHP